MPPRPDRALAVLALAGAWLGGCSGLGGLELPQQRIGETFPGERVELAGVLDVADDGCIGITMEAGTFLVIWPSGSDDADVDERPAVRLPDGQVIGPGDALAGIGALTRTAPLVADRNGYWAHVIGYCAPDAAEVVVLDSARPID